MDILYNKSNLNIWKHIRFITWGEKIITFACISIVLGSSSFSYECCVLSSLQLYLQISQKASQKKNFFKNWAHCYRYSPLYGELSFFLGGGGVMEMLWLQGFTYRQCISYAAIQGELEVFYDLAFKEEAERALLSSCGCSGAVFQREWRQEPDIRRRED